MRSLQALLAGALILIGAVVSGCASEEEVPLGESCLSLSASVAQSPGDDVGEVDYEAYADLSVPPLRPEEALERFELEEGFRIEVVAHEPMIVDPVAMDIDADGRLWVINMPDYSRGPVREILQTTGERTEEREEAIRETIPEEPAGEIVVLEDTTGDGRMDTRRVFYEGLLLPRAIKVLRDGVLVGEPPNLWFIEDTNGDGTGDRRELLSDAYTTPRSPQSGPNTLWWGMDNWIHSAHFPSLRREEGQWRMRPFEALGQWGITHDDYGRLYSSNNSWPLQVHMAPYGYSERHPTFDVEAGLNVRIAPNEPVWPAHAAGVNRGYQVGTVTREDDGTLRHFTGASSTVIYRGDQFGEEYRGNAFTPEPAGNLIKRLLVDADPAAVEVEARFAYEGREFLTSTDERFRPVNIYNAPDGSLYIVDMYRGFYDYALWVTDYLADHVIEHDLDKPTGTFGRIYRIVREDREVDYTSPRFSELTPSEVAAYLRHANGQLRDQAQQVLVQCAPSGIASELEEMVQDSSEEAYTRLQALWTLEGLMSSGEAYSQEQLTRTALEALEDEHPRVRAAAVRMLEPALAEGDEGVLTRLEKLAAEEEAPFVKLQLLASLGESSDEAALEAMAAILDEHAESEYFREVALTGVYQHEEAFEAILEEEYGWSADGGDGHEAVLASLGEAVEARSGGEDLSHLTEAERALYETGRERYTTCAVCHGPQGQGQSGIGASLAESEWVQSDPEALVRIVLHGFDGGAAERGENIPSNMPGHAFLSDEELAGILTFMRQSWGNDAPPVTPEEVERIREATSDRADVWTPEELRELLDQAEEE